MQIDCFDQDLQAEFKKRGIGVIQEKAKYSVVWEAQWKGAAFTRGAVNRHATAMGMANMLDNRKSQACTPKSGNAGFVHPVKYFKKA